MTTVSTDEGVREEFVRNLKAVNSKVALCENLEAQKKSLEEALREAEEGDDLTAIQGLRGRLASVEGELRDALTEVLKLRRAFDQGPKLKARKRTCQDK